MIVIPMLETVELSRSMPQLQALANDPKHPGLILLHRGKPVAVVQPTHGADVETVSVSCNPQFMELMRRSERSYRAKGGRSLEEICNELGIPAKPRKRASGNGLASKQTKGKPKKTPSSRKKS